MKCPSCGYDNPESAMYCSMCQVSFVKPKTESRESMYRPGPTATPATAPVEELNWFQRHLNITFLLPIFIVMAVGFGMGVTGYNKFEGMAIFNIMILAATVLTFILGAWYVYRKNRSFAWLILLFLPLIAWIIFLCLEDRSSERRYKDHRPSHSPPLTTPSKYGY